MSLEHAILGFLNYSPLSGYDLKKAFDVSVQHFWPADQSQIYRTLNRLMENGWVEMEIMEQTERPSRKVYQITSSGKEELLNWLTTAVPMPENRSAPLIQVFFAAKLSDEQVLEIFEHAADQLRRSLARYDGVPQRMDEQMAGFKSPREEFFWMLTLESGYRTANARLQWIQEVITRIKNGDIPKK